MLLTLPLLYIGALLAAEPLFAFRTPVAPVDVIVVLGGDGPARAEKAAAIYRSLEASSPRVLISGDGDCLDIARLMAEDGVPEHRVTVECESGNTWENAKFSQPVLAEMGASSAVLVTSWFHARRAIGCFRAFSPQIRWSSAPVERKRPLWEIAWDLEGVEASKEYLKVAWYAVRYGVLPSLAESIDGNAAWAGR